MVSHGFRSTASTLLNESGRWSADAIERSLAHLDGNPIRGIYDRGRRWDERVQMAQWWSDYIDALRDGAKVSPAVSPIPLNKERKAVRTLAQFALSRPRNKMVANR